MARLIYVELERLKNFKSGVDALLHLAEVSPASEAIAALSTRALLLLSGDARPEAGVLRGQVAELLDPRLEANGQWGELAPVLRLRLDVERRPAERKRLWMRIIDIEERMLSRPEQAMVSLARALAEDPGDVGLRERAERLAVRLRDLEGLLGIYEDIIESAQKGDPHRITYAMRCGELYEGSVGQPLRAAEFYDIALDAAEVPGMAQPDRLRILERIERLYRAVGEPQLLAKTLRRKAALSTGDDQKSARDALFEAAKLQVHGLQDFGAALETLNKLLERSPSDIPALRALAEAAEKQERWSEAAEALERELVAIGTSNVARSHEARFMLGVILDNRLGLSDAALVHFQAILEEEPNHPQTRAYLESRLTQRQTGKYDGAVFLTASYERTGDWQKAVEVLQAQLPDLEQRGDRKEIQTQLFKIAKIQEEQLNAPDLAFITLCRALKNEPSDPSLRGRLKGLARLNETVDDLIEVYDDEALAADVSGRSSLAAELREGSAELVASVIGDKPRAILLYEAILDKQAGRLGPLEALSALYAEAGRHGWVDRLSRTSQDILCDYDPKPKAVRASMRSRWRVASSICAPTTVRTSRGSFSA